MAEYTPHVLRVYDVLVATFPEDPLDHTVDRLQEEVLEQMATQRPRGVILDISTVHMMDSFFARTISETAEMIELMGAEPVIVGIRPAVALTAAELGYDLDGAEKALTTDHALELLGVRVEGR